MNAHSYSLSGGIGEFAVEVSGYQLQDLLGDLCEVAVVRRVLCQDDGASGHHRVDDAQTGALGLGQVAIHLHTATHTHTHTHTSTRGYQFSYCIAQHKPYRQFLPSTLTHETAGEF